MKWFGLARGFLLAGLVLLPVLSSGSSGAPMGEATFVVG